MRVVRQGSVPPMISIAIGMHAAARRESQWQVKILREVGPRVVARVCDCNPVPQTPMTNRADSSGGARKATAEGAN